MFHASQPGQRPVHLGEPVPHSPHRNTERTLAIPGPYRGGLTVLARARVALGDVGLLDDIRTSGIGARRFEPPVVVPGRLTTAAETARRIVDGDDILPAARDLLDQAGRASVEQLDAMLSERPTLTGQQRADALLAGIVEHLAVTTGRPIPQWVNEPERFCDSLWFVTTTPGLRATSLAQSPIALKRRGIMWPARSLRRI